MEAVLEVLPLALDVLVVLQLKVGLGVAVAEALIGGDELAEKEGVDATVLIVGVYGDKHEIDAVDLSLKGTEEVVPAERE